MAADSGDPLPVGIEFQIDELCEQFERAHRDGKNPSPHDYLRTVDPRGYDRLLAELVVLKRELEAELPTREDLMPLREFEALLCTSGVVEVQDLLKVRDVTRITNALELARELVSQRIITRYQAFVTLRGEATELNLGRYLILDRIGGGGMGEVFLARHLLLGRTVAVKMLKSLSGVNSHNRFTEEMRLGAELMHPNIVGIHDADQSRGKPFLVMEYIEGKDLRAKVKRAGPMLMEDVLDCIRQAALGLEFAHARSIIHRDIKPANLLYSSDGCVKILDFGLSKRDQALSKEQLTATGVALGTFDYMAPEQAIDARSVDHRADLYSLGCTMHYLLTGKPPFEGEDSAQRILAHRDQNVPDLPSLRSDVSSEIDDLFKRLLAKSPDQRIPTAGEVAKTISNLQDSYARSPTTRAGMEVESFTSISGIKFARIKAGEFMMGTDSEESTGWNDLGYHCHLVKLTKDYWLSVFPITQSQFQQILGITPGGVVGDDLPVASVSWHDAVAFVNRLSECEGLEPYYVMESDEVIHCGGPGYRLATEAEWEYACRAGTRTPWYFGEDARHLSDHAWTSINSDGTTHSVGQKAANPNGLYDMYGNVWEWCWDRYDELFYGYSPVDNPVGPDHGLSRVIRGGSFAHSRSCCSAARSGIDASDRNQNVGFRVARDA